MIRPGKFLYVTLLILLGAAAAAPTARANVVNEGNDAVLIEFLRGNKRPLKENLYPGQQQTIPPKTTTIRVVPIHSTRGDENISIKVVEQNGNEGFITKYGGSYELNKSDTDQAEEIIYKSGKVTNNSNIVVEVISKTATRTLPTKLLYIRDSMTLPSDVKAIQLNSPYPLRGDEIVSVEVLMPDGESYTITSIHGGAVVTEPEQLGSALNNKTETKESSDKRKPGERRTYVGIGSAGQDPSKTSDSSAGSEDNAAAGLQDDKDRRGALISSPGTRSRRSSGTEQGAETSYQIVE